MPRPSTQSIDPKAVPFEEPLNPLRFTVPPPAPFGLLNVLPPSPGHILLRTDEYRPSHNVTVRNDVDGRDFDLEGVYNNGTWHFAIPVTKYPTPFRFKFQLNASEANIGSPITVDANVGISLATREIANGTISFQTPSNGRFRHGIEGVRHRRDEWQEGRFRPRRALNQEFDAIVLGGGMTGVIAARQIALQKKQVLVLEMGSRRLDTHYSNLHRKAEFADFRSRQADVPDWFLDGAAIMLGGRSLFWSGLMARVAPWELREFWAPSVSQALTSKYYDAAEAVIRPSATLGTYAQDKVKELSQTLANYTVMEFPWAIDTDRGSDRSVLYHTTGFFSTTDLIHDMADPTHPARPYITIQTGQMILMLLTQGNGNISGVKCYDVVSGKERVYKAKRYILALGSIESAKVALVSKLTDQAGLHGVGITDHPKFEAGGYQFKSTSTFPEANCCAKIKIEPRNASPTDWPFIGELGLNKTWHERAKDPILRSPARRDEMIAYFSAYSYGGLNNTNRIFEQGEGQRARVNYEWFSPGKYGTFEHLQDQAALVRTDVLGAVKADFTPFDRWKENSQATIHHAVGSLRMGDAATNSCVDLDQRFWGHSNLFVADASVFPYAPTPLPTLTAVALAMRVADKVVSEV